MRHSTLEKVAEETERLFALEKPYQSDVAVFKGVGFREFTPDEGAEKN